MPMSRLVIALVVGCSAPAPAPRPPAPAPAPPLFTIRRDSLGPLEARTPATLAALRAALRGLDVEPLHADGLEYRVSHAGVKLFDVIPDDRGAILNVHVVSPRIAVAGRAWRVGALFAGTDVTTCECWADQTVCFRHGDHVAVALAKRCRDAVDPRTLAGTPIRVAIWSPRPLAPGGYPVSDEEPDDSDDDEP